MTHDITINDLLALKPSSLTHDLQSFSVSTIVAEYPVRLLGDVLPYNQFDKVTIRQGSQTLLVGLVSKIEKVYSGSARSWRITFADNWYYLENCLALANSWRPVFNMWKIVGVPADNVVPKASIKATLESALSLAPHHDADYEVRITNEKMLIPWNTQCSTIANLLQVIRRWHPRMVSYYDYSGSRPKLIITDYDSLSPISLPLQPTDEIKAVEVNLIPRGDLVPPCVAIVSESTGTNGYPVSYVSKFPLDGDMTAPHAIVYRFAGNFYYSDYDSDGDESDDPIAVRNPNTASLNFQLMKIKGRQIDPDNMVQSFWHHHFPWMDEIEDSLILPFNTPEIVGKPWERPEGSTEEQPRGYDTTATEFELIEGQIHTKALHPKWCRTTVKQALCIRADAGGKWQEKFPNIGKYQGVDCLWGIFSIDLVTMDRQAVTYAVDGIYNTTQPSNGVDEPTDEPQRGLPYDDIVRNIWESMQVKPYDGSIQFVALGEATWQNYMGRRVSIVGGHPEWADIATMTEKVTHDLQTHVITLDYGSPRHLGIEDWIELMRLNQTLTTSASIENSQGSPESVDYEFAPKPEAPTISQQITASTGEAPPPLECGWQVRLQKDINGTTIGAQIKQGDIYVNGKRVFTANNSWVSLSFYTGNVFLHVVLQSDGSYAYYSLDSVDSSVGGEYYSYQFRIANMEADRVSQYVLGSVFVIDSRSTYYPQGPA